MDSDTLPDVSNRDVAMVFRSFIHEQFSVPIEVRMEELLIPFRTWKWNEWFPSSCYCNVVDLSTHSEIRSLYPGTARIIMHGHVRYPNAMEYEPSIYFVDSNNKRHMSYIRQPTKERLMEALKTSIRSASGRNPTAPSPPHTRPLNDESQNGPMIQVLQQILEVCNRIDNKMKA
jgi:hypothetical protein